MKQGTKLGRIGLLVAVLAMLVVGCRPLKEKDSTVVPPPAPPPPPSFAEWIQSVEDPAALATPFVLMRVVNGKWRVGPWVVGVCRNPHELCDGTVRLILKPPYIEGSTFTVEGKEYAPPCFAPFELSPASPSWDASILDTCPTDEPYVYWDYKITCSGSDDCPEPLDPRVVIQN